MENKLDLREGCGWPCWAGSISGERRISVKACRIAPAGLGESRRSGRLVHSLEYFRIVSMGRSIVGFLSPSRVRRDLTERNKTVLMIVNDFPEIEAFR